MRLRDRRVAAEVSRPREDDRLIVRGEYGTEIADLERSPRLWIGTVGIYDNDLRVRFFSGGVRVRDALAIRHE